MTLPLPVLDNRTFAQLVSESVGQINRLAPSWTDYNASDPGITLVELLSWLSEQSLYRADRTTREMTRAFLRFVGIAPHPARVAATVVVLATADGNAIALPDRVQLADATGAVTFETREAATVSPARLVQLLAGADGLADITAANDQPYDPATSDLHGTFQPFGTANAPGAALYLGFDRALGQPGDPVSLHVWTLAPAADAATAERLRQEFTAEREAAERDCPPGWAACLPDWRRHYGVQVVWEFYAGAGLWLALPGVADETRALSLTGFVRFVVPHGHVAGGPGTNWYIRCRIARGAFDCVPRLDRVAVNAVTAEHAVSIDAPEPLGTSRGHADERYSAALSPIVAGSTRLTLLSGSAHDGRWAEALDWDLAGPHDRVYLLEPEPGRITGGNGRCGAVFPAGWDLVLDYRVGAGSDGNIAAATLSRLAATGWNTARIPGFAAVSAEVSVAQPYAAFGGADAEPLAGAEARAVAELARPTKTVTIADFVALALATPGVPVGRAKAVANHFPALPCFDAPGSVTVVIVPDCPGPAPLPGDAMLRAVERFLHRRRPVTTELHVIAPNYVKVTVSATLQSGPDGDAGRLKALAQQALDSFFNPLTGGPDGAGWPIGRSLYRTEVMTILAALPGVLTVSALTLAGDDGVASCDNLALCAGDLVQSMRHHITVTLAATAVFSRSRERECP